MKDYLTVAKPGEASFEEKHSKFIAHVKPVTTPEEATAFIEEIKKQYWDAKHNVSAFVLRDGTQRFSDDGEPQGTAGMPTLDVLLKSGVTDVCVVTTRYFGGVLLGAGGLVRAYSHSASIGLDAAGIVEMKPCKECRFSCDYTFYGKVPSILSEWDVDTLDTTFEDDVKLTVQVPETFLEGFSEDLVNLSSGKVTLTVGEDQYRAVSK